MDRLALEAHVLESAAQAHAAMARLVELAAEFERRAAWEGDGIRSCAHWLTINTGLDLPLANELLRVGRALGSLPQLRLAFQAGRLSFDKLRVVTQVATAADEEGWLNLALSASGSQLSRICREARHVLSAEQEREQRAGRGVWMSWREDGMWRLLALLPPVEGAQVRAALEALAPQPEPGEAESPAPKDQWAAAQADALVAACQSALEVGAEKLQPKEVEARVILHVDAGVLSAEATEGRCHLSGGPRLHPDAAGRLACDSELIEVRDQDGLPIDMGRRRRIVTAPLRRALHVRDRQCRFPGCGVPAAKTHAHHIQHWARGGSTDMRNLVSLCGFHHRGIHDGAFTIRAGPGRKLRFERSDGRVIGPVQMAPVEPPQRVVGIPVALGGGARYDLPYTVEVLLAAKALAASKSSG